MRIVADTNTALSGLLRGGPPRQDYRRLAYLVEPQPLSAPASRDPDDDHVLACALAARADLIVTRDLDLLDLKSYQDIPILAAVDAVRRIEAQR